ncbi:MFS transporter ['Paenibacillus yunnanensis' Narsing Rao et al. 2020]|uniref:MFS transporter n=1 Tax=Paenibacillus tengchongensis TaxID=2608684 RepID=UPI00124DC456|nr:MFS transporter [Paenibacillus tengchongensis]
MDSSNLSHAAAPVPAQHSYPVLYKNKVFLLLFSASTFTVLGNAFHSLALSLWVLQVTGSAAMMSIMTVTNMIVCSLLGSIAGTIADRVSRRKLMLGAYLVQCTAVLAIASVMTMASPPFTLFVCLTAIVTAAGQFHAPAFQASLLNVVGREHIQQAAGWMTLSENISRSAGYALGGIFVAAFGGAPAILVDGLTFLLAFVLVTIAGPFAATAATGRTKRPFKQDILGGFRYIWGNSFARAIVFMLPVLSLFFLSCLMLTQVMAVQVWRATPFQFGLMESCIPLGYMLGSALILSLGNKLHRRGAVVCAAMLALGPLYALLSLVSSMVIAIAFILFIGVMFSFCTLLINIILRLEVPDELQGRLFGVLNSVMTVAPPLGLALFSTASDAFGPPWAMLTAGLLLFLLSGLSVLKFKAIREYR